MHAALAAGAAALISFTIYLCGGTALSSYDSAPNSLLAIDLLEYHRLDFDAFRGSYFTALDGQYAFVEAPNGHLTSVFPIGTAIVSLPVYALLLAVQSDRSQVPAINTPAFEPLRRHDETIAAAAIAAVSVAMLMLCALELGSLAQASVAAAVYAFATPIWSTGSQALWQHGPVNLFVLATIYALFRALRARSSAARGGWIAAAGVCAGLLPVIRPTALLFSFAALVFAGWTFRRAAAPFVAGALLGAAPGAAWNLYYFGGLAGGYADDARAYAFSAAGAAQAFAALLVSPSRGLLCFSPVLALSAIGAVRGWRSGDPRMRLVLLTALAAVLLVVQYAFYRYWWAGYSYGPRFLTDVAGVAALLLVGVIPAKPLGFVRGSPRAALAGAGFAGLFAFSAGVQFAGVNSGAAGAEWNAVPVSIDRDPRRVWSVRDNQIERNARAAYFRLFAWNVARTPVYVRGVGAAVRSVSPALTQVAAGSSVDTTAGLHNVGRSPAYGYPSGVYIGQLRVGVRIVDAAANPVSEQALYVDGSPPAGAPAIARGTLAMPQTPGTYVLEYRPILVGGAAPGIPTRPLRLTLRVNGHRADERAGAVFSAAAR